MTNQDGQITKKLIKGCPQGSVCGPVFWDFVTEGFLTKTDHYTDDILLLTETGNLN